MQTTATYIETLINHIGSALSGTGLTLQPTSMPAFRLSLIAEGKRGKVWIGLTPNSNGEAMHSKVYAQYSDTPVDHWEATHVDSDRPSTRARDEFRLHLTHRPWTGNLDEDTAYYKVMLDQRLAASLADLDHDPRSI